MTKKKYNLLLIIGILISALFVFMSSGFFYVKEIEINGNDKITDNEVLKTIGLDSSVNIFVFNSSNAKKILLGNQYIESVSINKQYPAKVSVDIKERRLSGYIEYMNGYLYIDENGRVLEVSTYFTENLPIMVGLEFTGFNIGEYLDVDNFSAFENMVILARIFNKYDVEGEIIRVDVSKESDIHIYIRNVDVIFGDIGDADEKIRTLKAIMEKLDGNSEGFLDISDIKRPPYFRFMT